MINTFLTNQHFVIFLEHFKSVIPSHIHGSELFNFWLYCSRKGQRIENPFTTRVRHLRESPYKRQYKSITIPHLFSFKTNESPRNQQTTNDESFRSRRANTSSSRRGRRAYPGHSAEKQLQRLQRAHRPTSGEALKVTSWHRKTSELKAQHFHPLLQGSPSSTRDYTHYPKLRR